MKVVLGLGKMFRGLEKIIDIVVMIIVFVIFLDVVVGVIFRYFLNHPLKFSFDLATLLFAWATFLGLASAARKKAHIGVDFFTNYLSANVAKYVDLVMKLISIAISAMMFYLGWVLTMETGMELTGLEISQKWLYASIPAGFLVYIVFLIGDLMKNFFGFHIEAEKGIEKWD